MIFLCGLFFPIEGLPLFLQPLSYALPLTYGADILHGAIHGSSTMPYTLSIAALAAFCAEQARKSGQEIELKSDSEVLSGFKVGFKDKSVYLDFTGEAVADALGAFLRPELAKAVSGIAREQQPK